MAKDYQYATQICIGLSIVAAIGIVLGVYFKNPIIVIGCVLPSAAYEVYRTEGFGTRLASIGLLGILIAELVFIIKKINFDITFLMKTSQNIGSKLDNVKDFVPTIGKTEKIITENILPLGDVKNIAPVLIILFSVYLFSKTAGRYTKWLSVIIVISALAIIYIINPLLFKQVVDKGVQGIK